MNARTCALAALGILVVGACGSGSSGTTGGGGGSGNAGGGGAASSGTSSSTSSASSGSTSSGSTSSSGSGGEGALVTYGQPFEGGEFHLGPVDYAETHFHNACAPGTKYDTKVQAVEGVLLAGVWNAIPNVASYCDACIWVETAKGKSALLRVVTYGDGAPNSIDVSPEAFAILNSGEYPRDMTWQLARCPDTGPMMYEVQTGSNEWWTSLWVRNARVPLVKVEVQSKNHPSWVELERGSDGTLTDASGFGAGDFSLRSTGIDGQTVVDTFAWPSGGIAGAFLTGKANFH